MMMQDEDMGMDTSHPYEDILKQLKTPTNRRDPRSIRLAAVVAAMLDVVGNDGQSITATKVYAATVPALECTLKNEDALGSLSTQVALLELLRVTVPEVENPAVLEASLPVTSRVLRAIVTSSLEVNGDVMEKLDTKDELGGINAVLRGICRAATEVLRCLPFKANIGSSEKNTKQFFFGTLLALFDEHRPKVRKAAQNGIVEVLSMEERTLPVVVKAVTAFVHRKLKNALKNLRSNGQSDADLIHLLSFLERSITYLDTSAIGQDLMEILLALFQNSVTVAQSEFVSQAKTTDATPRVLATNAVLAVIKEMSDNNTHEKQQHVLNEFAPRALASLLQLRASAVYAEGAADLDLIHRGRILFGHVLISCCRRIASVDKDLVRRLLPLSILTVLKLCQMAEEEVDEAVAESLMAELTVFFRSQLPTLLNDEESASSRDECIAKCFDSLEQVMKPHFQTAWTYCLKPLAIFLQQVEDHERTAGLVSSLLKLMDMADEEPHTRKAIEDAVGAVVEGVGIEKFWQWVPWTAGEGKRKGIEIYQWVIPVMNAASTNLQQSSPHLSFFQKHVLALARESATLAAQRPGDLVHDKLVTEFWSLFPCFCRQPADLNEGMNNMVPTLLRAMEDVKYPQLLGIVCSGLFVLCTDVSQESEEGQILEQVAVKLLPALFKTAERLHTSTTGVGEIAEQSMDVDECTTHKQSTTSLHNLQNTQAVMEAISCLASLAPNSFVLKLFKKLIHRLLEESQRETADNDRLSSLLNLAQALVVSKAMDELSIALLYRTMKPLIRSDEHGSRVQKLAYKVLVDISRCHHSFVSKPEILKELIGLLTGTALTSQIPARCMRLRCMKLIMDGFDKKGGFNDMDAVSKMTGEVLLCLKDSKTKTRDAAFHLLLSLAETIGNNVAFLQIIIAAMGAETPHMRSAAVMASSRLVFEFGRHDANMQSVLPSLLQTILVLFDDSSREVIKSAVGFVRVCVAAMPPDQLEPLLSDIVSSQLKNHKGKDRFRAKIKIILKKLVRMFGYEKLTAFVPEGETRLLVHMRKLEERAARRKSARQIEGVQEDRGYDEMVGSDEYDSDDGRTLMTGLTQKTSRTAKSGKSALSQSSRVTSRTQSTKQMKSGSVRLPDEADGEVVNMLSLNTNKRVQFAETASDDDDSDAGVMEFDDRGRLVITDETGAEEADVPVDDDFGNKRRRLNQPGKFESAKDAAQNTKGKKKNSVRQLGSSYKSKKAGGDVKRKGQKFEPYAFVPLDGRSYSKKNRRRAVEQMTTVVPQSKRKRN